MKKVVVLFLCAVISFAQMRAVKYSAPGSIWVDLCTPREWVISDQNTGWPGRDVIFSNGVTAINDNGTVIGIAATGQVAANPFQITSGVMSLLPATLETNSCRGFTAGTGI